MPDRYCRNFQGLAAAVANTWAHCAIAPHTWRKGTREWGSNSKPFEVINEQGLVAVAKPGASVGDPDLRRAAHEKLASDLAFLLRLPIPPVTLCDEGDGFDEKYVAVSAWAFAKAEEWPKAAPNLTQERMDRAEAVSSAIAVFETWIGASDRKPQHVLVNDDGDDDKLDLAYIDHAFAFTKDWKTENDPVGSLSKAIPIQNLNQIEALEMVAKIEALEEKVIAKIVNQIGVEYLSAAQRRLILKNLLTRRKGLRALIQNSN